MMVLLYLLHAAHFPVFTASVKPILFGKMSRIFTIAIYIYHHHHLGGQPSQILTCWKHSFHWKCIVVMKDLLLDVERVPFLTKNFGPIWWILTQNNPPHLHSRSPEELQCWSQVWHTPWWSGRPLVQIRFDAVKQHSKNLILREMVKCYHW